MSASYTTYIAETLKDEKVYSLLEPACGDGQNLREISSVRPDIVCEGNDIEEKWGVPVCDIRDLSQYEDKSYDVVLFAATLLLFGHQSVIKILKDAERIARKLIIIVDKQIYNAPEPVDEEDALSARYHRDYTKYFNGKTIEITEEVGGWNGKLLKIRL